MSVAIDTGLTSPFLGLRYFDEEHSHLFFGRDVQINDILEKLRRSRLVTVMGSSGSGKSSLVRAGVIPRLKAGLLNEAGARWRIAKVRPGRSPIASLTRELERALATDGLEITLRRGPLGLVQAVEECRLAATENVLIVVDQFEEIFRYQREASQPDQAKEEAASFVKLLLEATSQRTRAIYVIVTMRSDYLGNCVQFRDLPERINEGLYLVPRMRRDQLKDAIAGPVAVVDEEIAPRLLQKLLNETGDDPDQLPVLQHALLRAWNAWNQAPRPLDLQDLDAVGGMKDGLSRHADEIFTQLSLDQQRIARVMFQQLSERDTEGREIRRPAPVAQIAAVAGVTEPAVEAVVEKFAARDAAFLYRNDDALLDITHESLIRNWGRVQGTRSGGAGDQGWMQEETEARDEFLLLVERAAKNDTLMGRALDDASAWRALGLNSAWATRYARAGGERAFDDVVRFVDACHSQATAQRRRRRWWLTGVVTAVIATMAEITMLWRTTEQQKELSVAALARSSTLEAARLVAADRAQEAFAHLARALRLAPDDLPARSWLADLVRQAREGSLLVSGPTFSHQELVERVVFSPDGRRIASASIDGTARVWDLGTGQPVGAPLQHDDDVNSAVFSPDGRRVVTASDDGTARVWDADTGQPIGEPMRHQNDVVGAVFSPDGRRIVTASMDHTARVWDAGTGQPVGPPLTHTDNVYSAVFSPDGRRILTTSGSTSRVWNSDTGESIGATIPHRNTIFSAHFSPNGGRIVTVSADTTARVWDAGTGMPVGAPLQHQDFVVAASFSPDGRRIATASRDNTARMWDAESGEPVSAPVHHSGVVNEVAFGPDGRRIVIASDNTVTVWDVGAGHLGAPPMQYGGNIRSLSFSPDGQRILTASGEGSARVWDVGTGQPVGAPMRYQEDVRSASFSPDGRLVLTVTGGNKPRMWDAETGRLVGALEHQASVGTAMFSPDGRLIVTTSADKMARLWDTGTRKPVGVPLQHPQDVHSAVFSSDGRRLFTLAVDSAARVWDVVTGQLVGAPLQFEGGGYDPVGFSPDGRRLVAVLTSIARVWDTATRRPVAASLEHRNRITFADFSPDGRRIATTSWDGTARVWDADTGQPVGAPLRHQENVNFAIFSADGRRIVTGSADKTARLWDARTGEPVGAPLKHSGNVDLAVFSPDGRSIVTAADGARVWDVLLRSDSAGNALLLADLAEVMGGYRISELGSVVSLTMPERLQRINLLAGSDAQAFVRFDVLLERFLTSSR